METNMKGLLIAAGIALGATLSLGTAGSAQAAPLASTGIFNSVGSAPAGHIQQAQVYIERRVRRAPPRRCREVVTRRVNQFGRVVVSRRVVCNRGGRW